MTKAGKGDPLTVPVEEIPLPPGDLEVAAEGSDADAESDSAASPEPLPVAALKFVGGKPREKTVPLDYHFEHEGSTVTEITVKKLTSAEVGELVETLTDGQFDLYDIYAEMTGFPAAVLRGLIDDDGERLREVGRDFLPPMFRERVAS